MSAPTDAPSREETLAALLADPDVARGFREAERVIAAEARAGGDRFVRFGAARPATPHTPAALTSPRTSPRPATPLGVVQSAPPATPLGATQQPHAARPAPTARANPHPYPPGLPGPAAEVITLSRRTSK